LTSKKVYLSLCLTNEVLLPEGVWGSGLIDPHFLDLGTSWRCVLTFIRQMAFRKTDETLVCSEKEIENFFKTALLL
jgi:hypothetical protein